MLNRALEIEELVRGYRRDFHSYPELGFEEVRTAKRIVENLNPLGYRVRESVGRTGVVAERGEGKPVIALRADMDALPIQEANDAPYASQISGVMHACGHDAHMAIALGVATLLAEEDFPGTVRFLFQPSEEGEDDEGISGAPRMMEDGALEGVDSILALHVDADLETGSIMLGTGMVSAGADTFYATIKGKGGHGAMPHEVVDPIYLAGYVILALNGIVSRRLKPFAPAVLSLGTIHAGTADNVIPDRVEISGTIRYMNKDVQKQIHAEIERALAVARYLGGDFEHRIAIGYPPMKNHPEVVELFTDVAKDLLGIDHIQDHDPEMGAEDFAFFTNAVPGAMFSLGCRIEGDVRRHHNARFDIDEKCLSIGVAVLAESALRFLRG